MILPRLFKLPPNIRQVLASPIEPHSPGISVCGWIKSVRRQKDVTFAVISDGSTPNGLQAVCLGNPQQLKSLSNGAAVRLSGKLVVSPGHGQEKELLVDLRTEQSSGSSKGSTQVIGSCDAEMYPIQKKALSAEYLRDHIHLRARTDAIAAIIRLRNQIKKSLESYFEDQGFCYVHTPILTGSDAEGSGDSFKIEKILYQHPSSHGGDYRTIEFFGRPAYLTVSHQLHLEALAASLSRVYTLSPCFRAEPSLTGRHLAEFFMLEAEWAFGEANDILQHNVAQVSNLVESCLRSVINACLENHEEVDLLWKAAKQDGGDMLFRAATKKEPWTTITYTDAIKELLRTSCHFCFQPQWGRPLQSEHERYLAETVVGGPVFVTDYPRATKPFYMRKNEVRAQNGEETVSCVDLIVPQIGELAGGSLREERNEILQKNLGSDANAYQWYLDLRRFGGAPHAGFGIGFERLVAWMTGQENVRETIPFPRWTGKIHL